MRITFLNVASLNLRSSVRLRGRMKVVKSLTSQPGSGLHRSDESEHLTNQKHGEICWEQSDGKLNYETHI